MLKKQVPALHFFHFMSLAFLYPFRFLCAPCCYLNFLYTVPLWTVILPARKKTRKFKVSVSKNARQGEILLFFFSPCCSSRLHHCAQNIERSTIRPIIIIISLACAGGCRLLLLCGATRRGGKSQHHSSAEFPPTSRRSPSSFGGCFGETIRGCNLRVIQTRLLKQSERTSVLNHHHHGGCSGHSPSQ